jgi:phage terminase large subunit-like protein
MNLEDGAAKVHEWASQPNVRIAMVAEDYNTLGRMLKALEGLDGIEAVYYRPQRTWKFFNGSMATFYLASEPEMLRGIQVHYSWIHGYCEWPEYLMFMVRLGPKPESIQTWDLKTETFRLAQNVTLLINDRRFEIRTNRNQVEKARPDLLPRLRAWLDSLEGEEEPL